MTPIGRAIASTRSYFLSQRPEGALMEKPPKYSQIALWAALFSLALAGFSVWGIGRVDISTVHVCFAHCIGGMGLQPVDNALA